MTVSHSVRWGGILLSVALLASLAWGLSERAARREAEMLLSARYQQAFFGALGQIESVELLLTKALVSGSERERIRYLTELRTQAFTASNYRMMSCDSWSSSVEKSRPLHPSWRKWQRPRRAVRCLGKRSDGAAT